MSNIETVQAIYEAFGRGDVEAILARLSEDVEWEYGVNTTDVPWLQPRRGRAGAAEFFQALAALEFRNFQVTLIAGSGNIVVGLCDVTAVVRSTGKTFVEPDEAHIWHFGEDGLVQRFRHRADTHQQWLAFHGQDTGVA
jgi:ketosteroid isomerase-like protein